MSGHWEHFEHRADIGVRGIGLTEAQAFEQTALGMMAVMTRPQWVLPRVSVPIQCQAADHELLLVDWLNALLFEMATRRMLFSRFEVRIENDRLSATAWGESLDAQRHRPAVEVKGATYTALKLARLPDETWMAQCVVDV